MTEPSAPAAFRDALSHFASGVTVITARTAGGLAGFTASAFTSLSLSPPLILVCVSKTASAHDAVVGADRFGVSILAERQAWIAEQFARSGVDRFEGVPLRSEGIESVPLLDGALAHLECRRHATHVEGDHTILIGAVDRQWVAAGRPLVHFARRFGQLAPDGAPRTNAAGASASKREGS
jgi:flavin reductase (DIM6/NTAB) family NADH-FMN oxidoreductase RutF